MWFSSRLSVGPNHGLVCGSIEDNIWVPDSLYWNQCVYRQDLDALREFRDGALLVSNNRTAVADHLRKISATIASLHGINTLSVVPMQEHDDVGGVFDAVDAVKLVFPDCSDNEYQSSGELADDELADGDVTDSDGDVYVDTVDGESEMQHLDPKKLNVLTRHVKKLSKAIKASVSKSKKSRSATLNEWETVLANVLRDPSIVVKKPWAVSVSLLLLSFLIIVTHVVDI